MLIKDGKFNIEEFKKVHKELKWQKAPRKLGINHSDFFYVGSYEDSEKKINIQIRPSMRMKVQESFKGFDKNGKKVPNGEFQFGTTVEVVVDNKFVDKIKELALIKPEDSKQKVSW